MHHESREGRLVPAYTTNLARRLSVKNNRNEDAVSSARSSLPGTYTLSGQQVITQQQYIGD